MALLDRLSKKKPAAGQTADAPPPAPRPRRRWGRRIAIGAGVLLAGLILFGYFAAPPLIRSILTSTLSEQLHRQVTVGRIAVNPFLLTVEIDDFLVRERDGTTPFVGFDQLRVDLEAESIYRRAPVLREVRLVNPRVHVVRVDATHYNFSDLIDAFASKAPATPAAPSDPARFSVNNIQLVGGQIDFDDRPDRTLHRIRDLSLAIPFLSNLPWAGEVFVQPAFHALVNGAPLDLKGRTRPFGPDRETSLAVKLVDVDVPFYFGYLPFELQARWASARLDADLDLKFSQPPGKAPNLIVSGRTALRDVKVTDLESHPLMSYPRLDVEIDAIDVFRKKVAIRRIALDHLVVDATRAADGSINLSKLTLVSKGAKRIEEIRDSEAPAPAPAAAAKADEQAVSIKVAEIRLDTARIAFRDQVPPGSFSTTLEPVNATVRNFDTAPGAVAEAHLDARTEAGEAVEADGRWHFADRTLDGTAKVSQVALKRYAPYYRDRILFDIDSGSVDLATAIRFVNAPGAPQIAAHDLSFALKDLKLRRRDQKEPFLRLGDLTLAGGDLDLGARTVTLAEIASHKLTLLVKRTKDGAIDLAKLTPAPQATGNAASPASPAPAPAAATPAEAPWQLKVERLTLDQYAARFTDEVPAEPVVTVIDPVRLSVQNLAIGGKPEKAAIDFAMTVNTTGKVSARGTVVPKPLAGDLNVAIAGVSIPAFQPYFTDRINITVTSGEIAAKGTATFALPDGGKPQFSYAGSAALNRLATVDKQNAEDFLKWESLFFDDIRLQGEPFRLEMKEVALTDFYSRLVVNADGTLNVQGIMAKDPGAATAPAPAPAPEKASPAKPRVKGKAATPPPAATATADSGAAAINRFVKIDQITLQGGTVSFTDHLIKPNVTATLAEVGGRVTGLMSDAGSRADVDLRGKLASQAPLSITGRINPLAGDLFADLKVSFRDIKLPAFTPYSGKYAGYTIEKGKLSLDLQYLIDQRKITASNRIVIDQFTFGDKVESADATKLPVQLAIALLKDRDGRIDLDIPVTGSLDDPKFRLGKVIWGVIVNLITKAVTAPFALIGSLFGGGGGTELSYLDFAPGSATFDAEGDRKVAALAKALRDRPALKLEIVGHADAERDRAALRTTAFDRRIKAQKLKDLAKSGQAPASLAAVTVEPGKEYEKYLAKAYSQEKFPKPRNLVGLEKSLPVPEMEKLMQTNIVIGDDDLRQLAAQRAEAVKSALLAAGDIAAERLFLVEAKAGGATGAKGSRVDFTLR